VREGQVRHDAERFDGRAEVERVALHDAYASIATEAPPQACDQDRIELDREDTSGALGQLVREHAGAGTDLDDQIAACDACIPDEVSGEARDEEVLTGPGA
jgi:hypothetical protein